MLLAEEKPLMYQCISEKVWHLHQLGMTINKIATQLNIDWKTVRKALKLAKVWTDDMNVTPETE